MVPSPPSLGRARSQIIPREVSPMRSAAPQSRMPLSCSASPHARYGRKGKDSWAGVKFVGGDHRGEHGFAAECSCALRAGYAHRRSGNLPRHVWGGAEAPLYCMRGGLGSGLGWGAPPLFVGGVVLTQWLWQILNDPSIIFCDEPTSGLDSFMAESVVQQLR
jgi:hypothetical protein